MEETLDSLQLVYRILVTLSIGVLVLVASFKSKPGPYQAAVEELRTLRATMPKVEALRDQQTKDYYRASELPRLIHEATPSLDVSAIDFEAEEEGYQFMPPRFLANQAQSIDSYYDYLKLAPKWDRSAVHKFEPDAFSSAFRAFVQKYNLKSIKTLYIGVPKDEAHDYAIIEGKCTFHTQGERDQYGGARVLGYDENIVPCAKTLLNFPSRALQMLVATGLVEKNGDEYLALPAIRAVWDTAKGQDIQILQDILQRKALLEKKEAESKLDIAGLSVQASTAVLIGPPGLAVLLVLLLALLIHVSRIYPSAAEKVRTFPWFGLWRNLPGAIVSFGSVVVAPIGAGLALILVALPSGWARSASIVSFLLIASTTSSLVVLYAYRLTRPRVDSFDHTG